MIRANGGNTEATLIYEGPMTPEEAAVARAQTERFEKNWKWFEDHMQEIYDKYPGKNIIIAGQELFVGDDPDELIARARAAHPEDDGKVLWTISKHQGPRVYAALR